MMQSSPPRDVRALIALLGQDALAAKLSVPRKHVSMMRHRNCMSARHWAPTADLARALGHSEITMEWLSELWASTQASRRSA